MFWSESLSPLAARTDMLEGSDRRNRGGCDDPEPGTRHVRTGGRRALALAGTTRSRRPQQAPGGAASRTVLQPQSGGLAGPDRAALPGVPGELPRAAGRRHPAPAGRGAPHDPGHPARCRAGSAARPRSAGNLLAIGGRGSATGAGSVLPAPRPTGNRPDRLRHRFRAGGPAGELRGDGRHRRGHDRQRLADRRPRRRPGLVRSRPL